jgi:cAMP-specific phosphodiesterase 4
MILGYNIA